ADGVGLWAGVWQQPDHTVEAELRTYLSEAGGESRSGHVIGAHREDAGIVALSRSSPGKDLGGRGPLCGLNVTMAFVARVYRLRGADARAVPKNQTLEHQSFPRPPVGGRHA